MPSRLRSARMRTPTTISGPDDPRVSPYLHLRDAHAAREGLFIAEGELVVRLATSSRFRLLSVLGTAERLASLADAIATLPDDVDILQAPTHLLQKIVGFPIHRGVLAAGVRGPDRSPAELLARAPALLIAEDIANHDNLGGLFRVASALMPAGSAVLLSPRCCDPLYRKSLRVSMGHALHVPYATLGPWPDGLASVRAAGFRLVALTPDGLDLADDRSSFGRVALIVGAEGPGLSLGALAASDIRVRIPMRAGVDSLNVVVAAGIALAGHVRPEPPDARTPASE